MGLNPLSKRPVALLPLYPMSEPNVPVSLYEGELTLEQCKRQMTANGAISMGWLPTPRLAFSLQAAELSIRLGECHLSAPGWKSPVKALVTRRLVTSTGSHDTTTGRMQGRMCLGEPTGLKYITFHLANFCDYQGAPIVEGTHSWAGRAKYENDEWLVLLDSLGSDIFKRLEESGGYAITHVGKLQRKDGALFCEEQAFPILGALRGLFTFSRCQRVSPILRAGFGEDCQPRFTDWTCYAMDSWTPHSSWFDLLSAREETGFKGFWSCWSNESWRETVERAIFLYVESCGNPINMEKGIILLQAALELLSSTRVVEQEKVVSEQGFSKLSASDKMRLLLSHSGIPLMIPTKLAEFCKIARAENWFDGPEALAQIRNVIVHSSRNLREKRRRLKHEPEAIREAWTLAMWYVELALLRFFDYNGIYTNRTKMAEWAERGTKVPWAK